MPLKKERNYSWWPIALLLHSSIQESKKVRNLTLSY
jgi:hypothetical protein